MGNAVVIVAAGRGTRAGEGLPKQWRDLAGKTVLARTLNAFRAHPEISDIVLVLHADDMPMAAGYEAHTDVTVVVGGANRAASVKSGLAALEGRHCINVLIQDVARPLVSDALISRIIEALATTNAAAPAVVLSDALWIGHNDTVTGTKDRTNLYRAQTPQGFRYDEIYRAHVAHTGDAADDVEVARNAGMDVRIVAGDENNFKITTAGDFERAEQILRNTMDLRVGNGFDVHKFGPNDHVMLCGVRIDHSQGLVGHSDADVGMHALTDAIYGALAEGDIGRHFPPSDDQWKGANSDIFLAHAGERVTARGFNISNADVTLICEQPKIGPHAANMAAALAKILNIDVDKISVKATTSERLGFTGREEGIAAMATVALVSS